MKGSGVAVIIPAHNERSCIHDTLESVMSQTLPADRVVVVDDFSDDGTGEYVMTAFPGVTVIRPEKNLGSKALAQNFALFYMAEGDEYLIDSPMVVTIDADTTLEPDSLEALSRPMRDEEAVKAVCGTVIPRNLNNPFTLGRLGEYLYSFFFPKRIQQAWGGQIHVVSGCFGCYASDELRARGGWHVTTLAEDMDLTADYHEKRLRVAFEPRAVCHPIEPYNWRTYQAQMKRWSAAYFQNITLHLQTYARRPVGLFVLVSFLDAWISGIIYPLTPLWLTLFGWQKWLMWFLFGDFTLIAIPILIMGARLHIMGPSLLSIPMVFLLRLFNTWFWFRALLLEWVLHRPLRVYVKGH